MSRPALLAPIALAAGLAACTGGPRTEGAVSGPLPPMPTRGISAQGGDSRTFPENTVVAIRRAAALGAHMVRLDVRLTRDGEIVLMRDATVDRTTDGTGTVAGMTLEQIQRLDAGSWKDRRFRGERVPTLAEVLATLPENTWIELSLRGGSELATRAVTQIARANRLHQVVLACDVRTAAAARGVAPFVKICRVQNPLSRVRGVRANGADFVRLTGSERQLLQTTEALEAAGIRVSSWCVSELEEVRRLFDNGVDFVCVDDVRPAVEVAREFGIAPLDPMFR